MGPENLCEFIQAGRAVRTIRLMNAGATKQYVDDNRRRETKKCDNSLYIMPLQYVMGRKELVKMLTADRNHQNAVCLLLDGVFQVVLQAIGVDEFGWK